MSFLRLAEVVQRTGLSESTIRRLEKRGDFPRRCNLSGRAVGWSEEEVEEWIQERLRSRSQATDKDLH